MLRKRQLFSNLCMHKQNKQTNKQKNLWVICCFDFLNDNWEIAFKFHTIHGFSHWQELTLSLNVLTDNCDCKTAEILHFHQGRVTVIMSGSMTAWSKDGAGEVAETEHPDVQVTESKRDIGPGLSIWKLKADLQQYTSINKVTTTPTRPYPIILSNSITYGGHLHNHLNRFVSNVKDSPTCCKYIQKKITSVNFV